jgi:hypothetical protein
MTLRHRLAAAPLGLALVLLTGPAPAGAAGTEATRARVVSAARGQLGRPFRGDCSGFVLSVLRGAGVEVFLRPARSRSESLFVASRRVRVPRPGDLAFFHHTYDRDRDGRADDPYTHVALVEAVEGRTVLLLHRSSRGIERVRMDVSRPSDRRANDPVRHPRRDDPPGTRRLAGELFAGYGAVIRR